VKSEELKMRLRLRLRLSREQGMNGAKEQGV